MNRANPRVNVTLEEQTLKLLTYIAKKKRVSMSGIAKTLIETALELEEDIYFSKKVEEIDTTKTKWTSHEKFWKQALQD